MSRSAALVFNQGGSRANELIVVYGYHEAFALTFATPIMLVYMSAQRYIEDGLSFSGMDG